VHIYGNEKMRYIETIPGMKVMGIKENNGGNEFNMYE
jgi:hypothetical protein